ncbi:MULTISPECIES: DJ-1/PfpI family protein [unclassified Fusibacter]|uniref:DJ-1/PfpI family protein n=1 Tax=unclassified Fusibacter TaxID=2624464 RepID=UPI001012D801|nr:MULTISPECIES: DJ-1/PfpI family protein [unclassified Fusibacter]MCK8058518.1 DJ-1/PfpI family protein [Fusibacter sp. A2]NPE22713.1 DJ-1/PfpI family protein [Fusibacter sp. A1]RXV60273.1 DJ-1/PfpI family protein [Fusibacter sp. A1]
MKLLLIMTKGVEMLEASAFIDVFGWYRDISKGDIEVVTCGFNRQVVSSFNLKFEVDLLIDEVHGPEFDAIAVPGGFGYYGFYEEAFDVRLLNLINWFNQHKKIVASVCVGALVLGKSGVLDGKNATTYHLMDGRRQNQLKAMGAKIVEAPVVVDDLLITSWCPSTAPEVALKTLELMTSKETADQIRVMMGY